jgi:hypothetical protein
VFVFVILFIYCLMTSPFLLIALSAAGGSCYYVAKKNVSIAL